MRISDWSSDVCSSDLRLCWTPDRPHSAFPEAATRAPPNFNSSWLRISPARPRQIRKTTPISVICGSELILNVRRSEEHTSELQSLMRISYAVFCLKKKKNQQYKNQTCKNKLAIKYT